MVQLLFENYVGCIGICASNLNFVGYFVIS